ncbi:MAG: hypothetical protein JWN44_4956 [Myxococcales bacterium]|nr:hypothetical protein [Myxococcales bacterium]
MRTRTCLSLLTFAVVAVVSARAEAKHVRYLGPHPVAAKQGGGYCYIESPHLHIYGPDKPALYQQSGDEYIFTGDPTPFGYEGDKHPFYGHHPVVVVGAPEPVYCLLDGPHFHAYEAPEVPEYKVKDGVAFYVAPIPQVYIKPARVRVINAEYRPYVTFRPTVEVAPPPEWRGDVYVSGPSVEVRAPGVFIAPPQPHVSVEVQGPMFVAPPSPRVVINAPAPHVVVGVPQPHLFVPGPPVVGVRVEHEGRWEHGEREGHGEHHDNGRHEGWGKHGGGERGHH